MKRVKLKYVSSLILIFTGSFAFSQKELNVGFETYYNTFVWRGFIYGNDHGLSYSLNLNYQLNNRFYLESNLENFHYKSIVMGRTYFPFFDDRGLIVESTTAHFRTVNFLIGIKKQNDYSEWSFAVGAPVGIGKATYFQEWTNQIDTVKLDLDYFHITKELVTGMCFKMGYTYQVNDFIDMYSNIRFNYYRNIRSINPDNIAIIQAYFKYSISTGLSINITNLRKQVRFNKDWEINY